MKRLLALIVVLATVVPSTPVLAQDKLIKQEITFARGLAIDGFVGLANEVLERLAQRKGLDEETLNRVRLEKARLRILDALVTKELTKKIEKFDGALEVVKGVLERHRGDQMAIDARLLYCRDAILPYGEILQDTIANEATDPELAAKYRERANKIYEEGIKAAFDTKAMCEGKRANLGDFLLAWQLLCKLKKEFAAVAPTKELRKTRLEMAIAELEDFILEVGEETPAGTSAVITLAQCYELKGDVGDAKDLYLSVRSSLWELFQDEERVIPPSVVPTLARIIEEAYRNAMRITLEKQNDVEGTLTLGEEMIDRIQKNLGVQPSMPDGYWALYYYAAALLENGDSTKAAKLAKDGAEACGSRVIGLRYTALLKRASQGDRVDPATGYQLARGEFAAKKYTECIRLLKKVVAALDTEELKFKYGLTSFDLMASCYRGMNRLVEATYAYGEGCYLFGKLRGNDKKYGDRVELTAIKAMSLADQAFKASDKDPALQPLKEYGRQVFVRYTRSPDKIIYEEAKKHLASRRFPQAKAEIAKIKKVADYYERGMALLVKIAYEESTGLDFAEARKLAKRYLEGHIKANPNTQASAADNRKLAVIEVKTLLGQMAYEQAVGDDKKKIAPKPAMWDEVIRLFTPFKEEFPGQHDTLAYSYFCLGRAWSAKGDLKKAESYFKELKSIRPNSKLKIVLAMAIFTCHKDRVDAMLADDKTAKSKLDKALTEAVTFGRIYMEGTSRPDWAVMRAVLDYSIKLNDLEGSLATFQELRKAHGKSGRYARIIVHYVIPDVVTFLQREKEFNRAKALVDELLAQDAKRYTTTVIWLAIRNHSGWLEVNRGKVTEVNGTGDLKTIYEGDPSLLDRLYKTVQNPTNHFKLRWYRIVAQMSYVYLQAGAKDSALFDKARTFVRKVKGINDFATVKTCELDAKELKELKGLKPAERKRQEARNQREREDLYRIYRYLAGKLGL